MEQFQLTLKNEKIRQYDRIAFFFLLINLAIFIYLAVFSKLNSIRLAVIPTSLLIYITLIYNYLVSKNRIKNLGYNLLAEYAISLCWIVIGYLWIGVAIFLFALMYKVSKRSFILTVNKEKISYPSFPTKKIAWSELNNIILKDRLLTIDFKNNKFIQQPVDETKTAVNEQEFNDFCKEQLNQ